MQRLPNSESACISACFRGCFAAAVALCGLHWTAGMGAGMSLVLQVARHRMSWKNNCVEQPLARQKPQK